MTELCSILFLAAILFFGGHIIFSAKKLHRVLMNFHAKSGAFSLKIDRVMLNLVLGGHFVFWQPFYFFGKKWLRAIMNYYAKSGASSLKIDWVMLNLVLGGHFFGGHLVFWWILKKKFQKMATKHLWVAHYYYSLFLLTFCKLHISKNKITTKDKWPPNHKN